MKLDQKWFPRIFHGKYFRNCDFISMKALSKTVDFWNRVLDVFFQVKKLFSNFKKWTKKVKELYKAIKEKAITFHMTAKAIYLSMHLCNYFFNVLFFNLSLRLKFLGHMQKRNLQIELFWRTNLCLLMATPSLRELYEFQTGFSGNLCMWRKSCSQAAWSEVLGLHKLGRS